MTEQKNMTEAAAQHAAVEEERRLQFEIDKKAFDRLSPRQQKGAQAMANAGFGARWVAIGVVRVALGLFELALDWGFRRPFLYLSKLCGATVTAAARFAVKTAAAVIVKALSFQDSERSKILREKIRVWEKNALQKIDSVWRDTKELARKAAAKTVALVNDGTLALYRGTCWVLNPRLPSGKPVFYSEGINKAVGAVLGLGLCIGLGVVAGKALVMLEVIKAKFLFVTLPKSTAPLMVKVAQGVAAWAGAGIAGISIKLTTFPIIAAARQVLKTSGFMQGIAYHYNLRLREKEKGKVFEQERFFSRAEEFTSHVRDMLCPELYRAKIKMKELAETFNDSAAKRAPAVDGLLLFPQRRRLEKGTNPKYPAIFDHFVYH